MRLFKFKIYSGIRKPMKLWSVTPFSAIDYPWKVACIVFTSGCNYLCPYCHNKEFVLPSSIAKNKGSFIPETIFFRFLEKRVGLLDAVSICWWEPTLQKDLELFCARIKSLWFLVKIDTNGSNPNMLKNLVRSKVVDYIAMDIKSDFETYNFFAGKNISQKHIIQSIDIIQSSGIEYEFRTTFISPFHTKETVENIGNLLTWAKKYYLQNFREWDNLDPNFPGKSFSQKQLLEFKRIMEKYVVSAEIRV